MHVGDTRPQEQCGINRRLNMSKLKDLIILISHTRSTKINLFCKETIVSWDWFFMNHVSILRSRKFNVRDFSSIFMYHYGMYSMKGKESKSCFICFMLGWGSPHDFCIKNQSIVYQSSNEVVSILREMNFCFEHSCVHCTNASKISQQTWKKKSNML